LASRPTQIGESRNSEGLQVLIDLPFGVAFQVNQTDRRVLVLRLWTIE